jgi:hypothetical protein
MQFLAGTFVLGSIGALLLLPSLLVRLGVWKTWYLAPSIPPFTFKRSFHLWPFALMFLCTPLIAILPLGDQAFELVIASIGIAGILLGIGLAVWAPRWAKPAWQRRLEDRYHHDEIATFVRVWRQIDRKEWGRLIETEEGLKQLVERAGGQYRRGPNPPAGPDDDRLWLVK